MKFNIKLSAAMGAASFLIIVLLIFSFGFLAEEQTKTQTNNPSNTSAMQTNSSQTINISAAKTLTVQEVSKHNSVSDCWVIVNNKVYDVTSYSAMHPGGQQAITGYCGKDMTSAFDNQHSSSRSANAQLANLIIGSLS